MARYARYVAAVIALWLLCCAASGVRPHSVQADQCWGGGCNEAVTAGR
jgi:hypothetical protein